MFTNESVDLSPITTENVPRVENLLEKTITDIALQNTSQFRSFIPDRDCILQHQYSLAATKGCEVLGALIDAGIIGGVITLQWLVVNPQYRSKGIGRLMLEHFEQTVFCPNSGVHKIRLMSVNRKSAAFYKMNGYVEEGVLKNHWFNLDFTVLAKHGDT